MRTVVAPLAPEVRAQLEGLDAQRGAVAAGFIARLWLEPYLGRVVSRGLLGELDARAVLFNRDSRPDQLVGDHRGRLRVADEALENGPGWRVIYVVRGALSAGVGVVVVLGVGAGHALGGQQDAYRAAERLAARLLGNQTSEPRKR